MALSNTGFCSTQERYLGINSGLVKLLKDLNHFLQKFLLLQSGVSWLLYELEKMPAYETIIAQKLNISNLPVHCVLSPVCAALCTKQPPGTLPDFSLDKHRLAWAGFVHPRG